MYRLGYDFIVASEMSSLNTEYSTLFFKHSGIPEGRRHGLVFKVTYLILKCLRLFTLNAYVFYLYLGVFHLCALRHWATIPLNAYDTLTTWKKA